MTQLHISKRPRWGLYLLGGALSLAIRGDVGSNYAGSRSSIQTQQVQRKEPTFAEAVSQIRNFVKQHPVKVHSLAVDKTQNALEATSYIKDLELTDPRQAERMGEYKVMFSDAINSLARETGADRDDVLIHAFLVNAIAEDFIYPALETLPGQYASLKGNQKLDDALKVAGFRKIKPEIGNRSAEFEKTILGVRALFFGESAHTSAAVCDELARKLPSAKKAGFTHLLLEEDPDITPTPAKLIELYQERIKEREALIKAGPQQINVNSITDQVTIFSPEEHREVLEGAIARAKSVIRLVREAEKHGFSIVMIDKGAAKDTADNPLEKWISDPNDRRREAVWAGTIQEIFRDKRHKIIALVGATHITKSIALPKAVENLTGERGLSYLVGNEFSADNPSVASIVLTSGLKSANQGDSPTVLNALGTCGDIDYFYYLPKSKKRDLFGDFISAHWEAINPNRLSLWSCDEPH